MFLCLAHHLCIYVFMLELSCQLLLDNHSVGDDIMICFISESQRTQISVYEDAAIRVHPFLPSQESINGFFCSEAVCLSLREEEIKIQ